MSQPEITEQEFIDAYTAGNLVKKIASLPFSESEDAVDKLVKLLSEKSIDIQFISRDQLECSPSAPMPPNIG